LSPQGLIGLGRSPSKPSLKKLDHRTVEFSQPGSLDPADFAHQSEPLQSAGFIMRLK
jgi:hypothetical protein